MADEAVGFSMYVCTAWLIWLPWLKYSVFAYTIFRESPGQRTIFGSICGLNSLRKCRSFRVRCRKPFRHVALCVRNAERKDVGVSLQRKRSIMKVESGENNHTVIVKCERTRNLFTVWDNRPPPHPRHGRHDYRHPCWRHDLASTQLNGAMW